MGNWINVHVAELEARIDALEWLVEVMDLAFTLEYERKHLTVVGNVEFEVIYQSARAAVEGNN